MPETLATVTAAESVVAIGGRSYRLAPLTVRDYGELEARLVSQRPDPLEQAADALSKFPPEQQETVLREALARADAASRVSADALHAYCRTRDGLSYVLWLMLRRSQPELTLEAAGRLLDTSLAAADDAAAARLQALLDEGVAAPCENPSPPAQ
jgi:hypothetical protein